jgi:hypothetical protein
MNFTKKFSDGYSLTPEKAAEMKRTWQAFQRSTRKQNKRAQLNYHGAGKFSFTAIAKQIDAFKEITISTHHSGFGMYQLGEANGEAWASYYDLLQEIANSDIIFLPLDEALTDPRFIAAGVEDISGKIYGGYHDEIFAALLENPGGQDEAYYFGILRIEVDSDYAVKARVAYERAKKAKT